MIHKLASENDLDGGRGCAYVYGLPNGKPVRTIRPGNVEIEKNVINGKTLKTEKMNRERVSFHPKPTYMEFPQDVKQGFVENMVVETTDDNDKSETDQDEDVGETETPISPNNEEEASSSSGTDGGVFDVDKKADEFIAKVREQIRLQRIDSIKRSSGQMKRNSAM